MIKYSDTIALSEFSLEASNEVAVAVNVPVRNELYENSGGALLRFLEAMALQTDVEFTRFEINVLVNGVGEVLSGNTENAHTVEFLKAIQSGEVNPQVFDEMQTRIGNRCIEAGLRINIWADIDCSIDAMGGYRRYLQEKSLERAPKVIIANMDADVLPSRKYIAKLIQHFDENPTSEAAFVRMDYVPTYVSKRHAEQYFYLQARDIKRRIYGNYSIGSPRIVIKPEGISKVGGFAPDLEESEDFKLAENIYDNLDYNDLNGVVVHISDRARRIGFEGASRHMELYENSSRNINYEKLQTELEDLIAKMEQEISLPEQLEACKKADEFHEKLHNSRREILISIIRKVLEKCEDFSEEEQTVLYGNRWILEEIKLCLNENLTNFDQVMNYFRWNYPDWLVEYKNTRIAKYIPRAMALTALTREYVKELANLDPILE